MTLRTFFRPTASILLASLLTTGIAAWLLVRTLVCGLNGSDNCFPLPAFVQVILLILFWPWVLVVRFGGTEFLQALSIVGLILSLAWVYALLCAGRWLIGLRRP